MSNQPTDVPRRLLVTSAGTGSANNLIRSLSADSSDLRVVGCHHDRFILTKSNADQSILIPEPGHQSIADTLGRLAREQRIDMILPVGDADTLLISEIKDRLPCTTYLPELSVIQRCQDKYKLAKYLEPLAIPVPRTIAIQSKDDIAPAFDELGPAPMLWCRPRTGTGSFGATMVKDAEQAQNWIAYWNEMRGVPIESFTLSEFLPGRDFNVSGLWHEGTAILIKMCERISYLDGHHRPSGTSSTPAVAKTIQDDDILDLCEQAVRVLDPAASGIFNIDLKQDCNGQARITEINAGRFPMITNIYDLTGSYNIAQSLVKFALGDPLNIRSARDINPDYYLIRECDTQPKIVFIDDLPLDFFSEWKDQMNN